MKWAENWDLSTIPDDLLFKASGLRMAARRNEQGQISNPKKLTPCKYCHQLKGVGELRHHQPICKKIQEEKAEFDQKVRALEEKQP